MKNCFYDTVLYNTRRRILFFILVQVFFSYTQWCYRYVYTRKNSSIEYCLSRRKTSSRIRWSWLARQHHSLGIELRSQNSHLTSSIVRPRANKIQKIHKISINRVKYRPWWVYGKIYLAGYYILWFEGVSRKKIIFWEGFTKRR